MKCTVDDTLDHPMTDGGHVISSLTSVVIVMQGALSYEDAHKIASRISTSALVKTALYGEDAKYDHLLLQDCI